MKRVVVIVAASFGWPAVAHADIYKCIEPSATIYQSRPCAPGQAQTVVSIDKRPTQLASVTPAPSRATIPVSRASGPVFRRTTITLGMSDDEVLNLPGWGVPTRIERSREGRVYRESWMYGRPGSDARYLQFANARLTGMGVDEAPSDRFAGYVAR